MPLVEFVHPAGRGNVYSQESADSLIGITFEAKQKDVTVGEGKVVKATVEDEGSYLRLIVEWPGEVLPLKLERP